MRQIAVVGIVVVMAVAVGCRNSRPVTPTSSPPQPVTPAGPAPADPKLADMSLGATIFTMGVGAQWQYLPFSRGMHMVQAQQTGCAFCHGPDGRGRAVMMFGDSPAITYSALRAPHEQQPAMYASDDLIRRAATQGLDEEGQPLDNIMPRWQLTDAEFAALLEHLKALDQMPSVNGGKRSGGTMSMGRESRDQTPAERVAY